MRVVAWNMNFPRSKANWAAFAPEGDYRCDIALLSEAKAPNGMDINVMSTSRTIGRDDVTHGGKKSRDWSTAVASPYPLHHPEDVWALPANDKDPDKDRRSLLKASREGSWTAAVVSLPNGEEVTAISLYGLLDELSDASVHRSLSDLTPLLDDERYNGLLLLGGDLNPLWSLEAGSMGLARVQGVFDRITKGFGLVDLLQSTLAQQDPPRGRLENCSCSLGDECRHSWTYRRDVTSTSVCQDDYLFASPALAARLEACSVPDFAPDSPSDHVPVMATFAGFDAAA